MFWLRNKKTRNKDYIILTKCLSCTVRTFTSWRKIGIQCNSDSDQRAHFSHSKTCVKRPLSKRQKIGFQYHLSLNAGQKYCSMLQGEHSAILSTFIKLPVVIKIFVLSFFEWPFDTGFTVYFHYQIYASTV